MSGTSTLSFLWGLLSRPDPVEAQAWETLAWLLDRGIPPGQALESALGKGGGGGKGLIPGEKVSSAFLRNGWASPGETAFLQALEEVGKLPQGLQTLARLRRERHRAGRAVLAKAAYPLLVLHLALVPLQIPLLLSRGFSAAAASFLFWWAGLEGLLLLLGWRVARAWEKGSLERWPLLGPWFLLGEKRRVLFLLGELHGAGILWDRAFQLAARSVSAPSLKEGLALGIQVLSRGAPPSLALETALHLQETCRGLLVSGEKAGRLQESLEDCGKALEDLSSRKARRLAGAAGAGLYVLAVGVTLLVLLRAFLALYSAPFQALR